MNYFLYLIGGVALLIAILLLFNLFARPEASAVVNPPAMVALFFIGIVMCALGRIIGLLKTIARNTARDQVVSQF